MQLLTHQAGSHDRGSTVPLCKLVQRIHFVPAALAGRWSFHTGGVQLVRINHDLVVLVSNDSSTDSTRFHVIHRTSAAHRSNLDLLRRTMPTSPSCETKLDTRSNGS